MATGDMPFPTYPTLADVNATFQLYSRIAQLEALLDRHVPGWRELDDAKTLQDILITATGNVVLPEEPR